MGLRDISKFLTKWLLAVSILTPACVRREKRAGVIEMIDRCALPCLGVVPYDRKLQKAQDSGRLPDAGSLSAAAYSNIAARLSGTETPLFSGMGALYRRRALAL